MTLESRREIEAQLLDWMAEPGWAPEPERFESIAMSLFRFQYAHCRPYALLCDAQGRAPHSVEQAREIPAVPTGAFKEFELRCFPSDRTVQTFRTSGTSTERRGQLHLDRVDLYEASLLASLRRCLLVGSETDGVARPLGSMRFLAAPPTEAPDSSLSHMFGTLANAEKETPSGFDLHHGQLDVESLRGAVTHAQERDEPILIAGTAFAFVHLLDEIDSRIDAADWRLPSGSRVMETGGFKGRSREVSREALHRELGDLFGLPLSHVINQYGMTELGSQFYDSTLVDPSGPRRKILPPWTRVRIVDPESLEDVRAGELGLISIQDLSNTGSIACIQTADLGRAILDDDGTPIGFDVLGRAEGAEARGCSIATDIMLEASTGRRP